MLASKVISLIVPLTGYFLLSNTNRYLYFFGVAIPDLSLPRSIFRVYLNIVSRKPVLEPFVYQSLCQNLRLVLSLPLERTK